MRYFFFFFFKLTANFYLLFKSLIAVGKRLHVCNSENQREEEQEKKSHHRGMTSYISLEQHHVV